jgi:NitT/TauT family transport system substrate-binding protein
VGLKPREKGGTVEIIPIKNSDVLTLFIQKQLDAAWVPEPWGTKLIKETKARLVLDERDLWTGRQFATMIIVVRREFLEPHSDLVEAFLGAHTGVVNWMGKNPAEAKKSPTLH